jgi:hypothetical protein
MTHISCSLLFVTAMVMACVPAEARPMGALSWRAALFLAVTAEMRKRKRYMRL